MIKPSIGLLSIGVHVVKNMSDWESARKELNYDRLKSIYPQNVLDTLTFIIEEYIEGKEFAETSPGNEQDLDCILVSDLKKYISPFR